MQDERNKEDLKNSILELLNFSDLDDEFLRMDLTKEELFDIIGLSQLDLDDLLDLLSQAVTRIQEDWDRKDFHHSSVDMGLYHETGHRFAPVGLAVYEKLFDLGEEPRIPTYLAVNRYQDMQCSPDCVLFWADVNALKGLYESLSKDGYYGATKRA